MAPEARRFLGTFRHFLGTLGGRVIGSHPEWYPSILADDHAPFELSIALSRRPAKLQFYFEALGDPPTLASNTAAALRLLDEAAEEHGLELGGWERVRDLFVPDEPRGLFTLLFGVNWAPGRPLRFKLYLNPQVRGPGEIAPLMREAMERLGHGRAWEAVLAARRGRDPRRDQLMYLCLDLGTDREARAKVYTRHVDASVDEIEALASVAGAHRDGQARRFYRLLAPGTTRFTTKPLITSLTFRAGEDRPAWVTLDMPMSSYAANDLMAHERVLRCIDAYEIDPRPYLRALHAVALRPLDQGNGIHSHVTLRLVDDLPRLTLYFTTEAYRPEPYIPDNARTDIADIEHANIGHANMAVNADMAVNAKMTADLAEAT